MLNQSKYIKLTQFKNLVFWDYYTLCNKLSIESNYPIIELKEVISQRKKFVAIEDQLQYKRCRVQLYGNGVVLRDEVYGAAIKTKKQQLCKHDDFLVAEIDAKFGGYGIVPSSLEGAIVSGHYFLFNIDKLKLSPDFLGIISKCNGFSKQVKATGSTNYAAIRPYHVLGYKIPLPSLAEQNALVAAYNDRIATADSQELQASIFEQQIETYLLAQLGIKIKDISTHNSILQLFQFSEMVDRWDLLTTQNSIFEALRKSKYPICEIGKVYDFISRGWKPNKNSDRAFKYVEIGAVDELTGITKASIMPEHQAPSRATQIIKTGDLIIGTTRPYLKKFAIVNSEYNNNVCSSGFQIINSKENNLEFLFEYLRSEAGVLQFKFYMTGALYPAITSKDLKKIKIPIPPLEMQNEIVAHITGLKKQIKQLRTEASINRNIALTDFEQKIFK